MKTTTAIFRGLGVLTGFVAIIELARLPGVPSTYVPLFVVASVLEVSPELLELRARRRTETLVKRTARSRVGAKSYFRYRELDSRSLYSSDLANFLAERHHYQPLRFLGHDFPIAITWKNDGREISPDAVLGSLNRSLPSRLESAPHLDRTVYRRAREQIREVYESGPVKYEGCDYCLDRIDVPDPSLTPRIDGRLGLYYDNILTQYAVEWELRGALARRAGSDLSYLSHDGTLPLRESIEALCDPLLSGAGRVAAMTVSTLLVFTRPREEGYWTILRRRSGVVGVSTNTRHVVPAGMFEAANSTDVWSIELNVWRELLEELYDEDEEGGSAQNRDYLTTLEPVRLLTSMVSDGSADHVVTGVVCDLLNLRTEICTVLLVRDAAFAESRRMKLNWEYQSTPRSGAFAVPTSLVEQTLISEGMRMVPSGAACLSLGIDWVRRARGLELM
ncbi:MAG: hypothetical protein ACYCPT_13280 [Acidimicrobiales bacterium]